MGGRRLSLVVLGPPLLREALGLRDLCRWHDLLNFDQQLARFLITASLRENKPFGALHEVLRDTAANGIPCSQVTLRNDHSLLRRLTVPVSRFGIVLRHAVAGTIQASEISRGGVISLRCGLVVPIKRFEIALRNTSSVRKRLPTTRCAPA